MSVGTKITMIATVWLFAAVALFWTGMWAGKINRWDGCDVGYLNSELIRICHTKAFLDEAPPNVPSYR